MDPDASRRLSPWDPSNPPDAVRRYLRPYRLEFDVDGLRSRISYRGGVSACFRRSKTSPDDRSGFHRFCGRQPSVYWEPRRHGIISALTADLLAAAEALGGRLCTKGSPAGPFGYHAEGSDVWVDLLDGGVGVEVLVWEHQTTNRVKASQRTTIRGARAFRTLTRALGFDHVQRKLYGEELRPELDGIDREIVERLVRK